MLCLYVVLDVFTTVFNLTNEYQIDLDLGASCYLSQLRLTTGISHLRAGTRAVLI